MEKVISLAGDEDLYRAAEKVFSIPPLDILPDADKVVAWRREHWRPEEPASIWHGPTVWYEADNSAVLVITESKQREIVYLPSSLYHHVRILFPYPGSLNAAREVIDNLSTDQVEVTFASGATFYSAVEARGRR